MLPSVHNVCCISLRSLTAVCTQLGSDCIQNVSTWCSNHLCGSDIASMRSHGQMSEQRCICCTSPLRALSPTSTGRCQDGKLPSTCSCETHLVYPGFYMSLDAALNEHSNSAIASHDIAKACHKSSMLLGQVCYLTAAACTDSHTQCYA